MVTSFFLTVVSNRLKQSGASVLRFFKDKIEVGTLQVSKIEHVESIEFILLCVKQSISVACFPHINETDASSL